MLISRSLPGMQTMGAKPITQSHQAQPQALFEGSKTGKFTMRGLSFPKEVLLIRLITTVMPLGFALTGDTEDVKAMQADNKKIKDFQNECRGIVNGVANAFSGKFQTYKSPFNFTITPTLSQNEAELVFSIQGPTGGASTVRHNIKEKSAKGKPAVQHIADLLMLEVAAYTRAHR